MGILFALLGSLLNFVCRSNVKLDFKIRHVQRYINNRRRFGANRELGGKCWLSFGRDDQTIVSWQDILDRNDVLCANRAGGNHAACRLGGGGITLLNDIVAGNYSESGSGLHLHGARVRLVHTTIAGNGVGTHPDGVNGDGVGIELEPAYNTTSRVVATNTILVSHTVGISVAAGSSAHLEATLWGDGAWANAADWAGEGAIITGSVNIWGEPAFANPGAGDYHIMAESFAVDAGVDAGVLWDVDGDARPDNCAYDIGADELQTGVICPRIYLPVVVRPSH